MHNDIARRFNGRQRVALYLSQQGLCAECGTPLEKGWHGDHKHPYSKGGITDVINGQALCPTCNLRKGSKDEIMDTQIGSDGFPKNGRIWQKDAWTQYISDKKRDWLLCATPGAGKTKWALWLARYLLDSDIVDRVVFVAPTTIVRDQWIEQNIVHLDCVKNPGGGVENPNDKAFEGCVVTYAQVASPLGTELQRIACVRARTLVVFDEIHHAGFPVLTWGEGVRYAFEHATRRIGLTGTPWRSDAQTRIPFVNYGNDNKIHVDFAYELWEAIKDGVNRYVEIQAYDGEVEYTYLDSCAQKSVVYTLQDEDDNTPVLRHLLKPDGKWVGSIIELANKELSDIRRGGSDGIGAIPDAKGLYNADNQTDARIVCKRIEKLTGEKCELIISEEADAAEALERFKNGNGRWAVAVNKISEGVDIPALYVCVYATRKKTPLYFRQLVGRVVRRRVDKNGSPREEEERPAIIFMPAVDSLKQIASQIQSELRYTLDLAREELQSEQGKSNVPDGNDEDDDNNNTPSAIPTGTSQAELNEVIFMGQNYTKAEYDTALHHAQQHGFGKDDVIKLAALLRSLGHQTTSQHSSPQQEENNHDKRSKITPHKYKQILKREINQLERRKAMALGIEHKEFNAALARRFGYRDKLTTSQLEELLKYLENLKVDGQKESETADMWEEAQV